MKTMGAVRRFLFTDVHLRSYDASGSHLLAPFPREFRSDCDGQRIIFSAVVFHRNFPWLSSKKKKKKERKEKKMCSTKPIH
jgi:hypothetical protein